MAFDLNKIKGLFVQTEDAEQKQKTNPENKEQVKEEKTNQVVNQQTNTTITPTGVVDQKFFDLLIKAIDEKNLPGEDYLEFMDALQAMKNIPLDEKIKVQTVLATLSTKGLSVQKIKESADYYKTVLENEKKNFYTELNSQINELISKRQKEIEAADELIKVKSEQIAKLTQEINESQKNILNIKAQINESDMHLKNTEASFNTTLNFIINQINDNISKVESLNK